MVVTRLRMDRATIFPRLFDWGRNFKTYPRAWRVWERCRCVCLRFCVRVCVCACVCVCAYAMCVLIRVRCAPVQHMFCVRMRVLTAEYNQQSARQRKISSHAGSDKQKSAYGCVDVWMHGRMDAWVCGCMGVWPTS